MLMSVKHYAFYRFGTMDHLQPSQISALASTAKWIFSLTFETTFMRLQTIFMPAHFFTCLKLFSNTSLLPLYQRVPYQMVHYWPFWWFASLSFIGSWIVVILVNRVMGQILGVASEGVTSHKS